MCIDDKIENYQPTHTPFGVPIGSLPNQNYEETRKEIIQEFRKEMARYNPMIDRMIDEYISNGQEYLREQIEKELDQAKDHCSEQTIQFYKNLFFSIKEVEQDQ